MQIIVLLTGYNKCITQYWIYQIENLLHSGLIGQYDIKTIINYYFFRRKIFEKCVLYFTTRAVLVRKGPIEWPKTPTHQNPLAPFH